MYQQHHSAGPTIVGHKDNEFTAFSEDTVQHKTYTATFKK